MGNLLRSTRWMAITILLVVFAVILLVMTYFAIQSRLDRRAEAASFERVGERFEGEIVSDPALTPQRIGSFAADQDVRWGVVSSEDGVRLHGNLTEWDPEVVRQAVTDEASRDAFKPVEAGPHKGEQLATYATPIDASALHPLEGGDAAVVFVRFYA